MTFDITYVTVWAISATHTFLQWGFAPLADIIQNLNINNNWVQALF